MTGLVGFPPQVPRLLPPQDDPDLRLQRRKALAGAEDTVQGRGKEGQGGMLEADRGSLFAQFL